MSCLSSFSTLGSSGWSNKDVLESLNCETPGKAANQTTQTVILSGMKADSSSPTALCNVPQNFYLIGSYRRRLHPTPNTDRIHPFRCR